MMPEQSKLTTNLWGDKFWKLPNGYFHRADGPAVERVAVGKFWYFNGFRHRADGPAVERSDGRKEWWINGKFIYREDPNG